MPTALHEPPLRDRCTTLRDDVSEVSATHRLTLDSNTNVHGSRDTDANPGSRTAGVADADVGRPVPMVNTPAQPESALESVPYNWPLNAPSARASL